MGMYYLDYETSPIGFAACSSDFLYSDINTLDIFLFRVFVSFCSLHYRLDCESCKLDKHYYVSYPSRANLHSSVQLELIRSDIWIPVGFPVLRASDIFLFLWINFLHDKCTC